MNPFLKDILLKVLMGAMVICMIVALIFFVWICLIAIGVIQLPTFN